MVTVTATDKHSLTAEATFFITIDDNPSVIGTNYQDVLEGDEGDNLIYGKQGNDTLTGGDGGDTFVFDTAPSIRNFDVILDFTPGPDKIGLDKLVFPINPDISVVLETGGTASSPDTRLLFNSDDGTLSFDPDGSGPKSASYICVLSGVKEITADDIVLL